MTVFEEEKSGAKSLMKTVPVCVLVRVLESTVPRKVTFLPESDPVFSIYMLASMRLLPGLPGAPPPTYQ